MQAVDIFLLTILAWGAYSGFKRGLIRELFSISAFAIAGTGSRQLLDKAIAQSAYWGYPLGEEFAYVLFILLFMLLIVAVIRSVR